MLRIAGGFTPAAVFAGLLLAGTAFAQGDPEDSPAEDAESQPRLVYHVIVEDPGASEVADKMAAALREAARGEGWLAVSSPEIRTLLGASPDDLVVASSRIAAGRQLQQEGLEHYAYVRLGPAEKTLEAARKEFLAAEAFPPMEDLLNIHLYLGVVKFYQRNLQMRDEFRRAVSIKPNLRPNLPPKVLQAIARAKATLGPSSAALKVEEAPDGAEVYVDGFPKGSADRSIVGLSEGMHYVWVRAPKHRSWFGEVKIPSQGDVTLRVQLEPVRTSVSDQLTQNEGERGVAAIARLLDAKRFVLLEVRSTVTGRSPYAVKARVFDAASERRIVTDRLSVPLDEEQRGTRLASFARNLMTQGPSETGPSPATIGAALTYFPPSGGSQFSFTYSFATATQYYDSDAKLVKPEDTSYTFTRHGGVIGVRYGLREDVSVFARAPFFYQQIDWDEWTCGTSTQDASKRTDSGFGDVLVGTNLRLRALERGAMAVVVGHVGLKLPTGGDHAGLSGCRVDNTLVGNGTKIMLGTGQSDVDLSLTGVMGFGALRTTVGLGYKVRMPGKVSYIYAEQTGIPGKLNIGDEQHVRVNAAWFITRWLAPELGIHVMRRNQTSETRGRANSDFTAPAVSLINARAGVIVDFTEQTQAQLQISYPVYGQNTDRFFPFDVTGPQASLGVRIAY